MTAAEPRPPDQIIASYFAAMRRGEDAGTELLDLFADDAVYIDPFSGTTRISSGKDEIGTAFKDGWDDPLPDLELEVHLIEIDGSTATARWTCRSPGLPGPVTGTDRYTIEHGKITRLEVEIDSEQPH